MPESPEQKRRKALELRLAGATYEQIAQAVGYEHRSSAHNAVKQAMEESAPSKDLLEAEDTELARLDAMLTGLWPKARRGDVTAVDRVLRIEERRSFLLAREEQRPEAKPKETTSLSDFEKRLRERQAKRPAKGPGRSSRSTG